MNTAYDALRTAQVLADHGFTDSDAVTRADLEAAADYTGVNRPADSSDRHAIHTALDAIGDTR